MATSIDNDFMVNRLVLQDVKIEYTPEWDGNAWVINPANVKLSCVANLGADETQFQLTFKELGVTDLPQGGQDAIQQLYAFIEARMADDFIA